ncbi:MAG TPA: hypothetical protein DDW20_05130, partial [Firmicutes bacterium]|nr:hypothetical protein [Bacillota bacterium]
GISQYASTILSNNSNFWNSEIEFFPFNNCIVNRKPGTNGKLSFRNILNFFKTRKLLSRELKKNNYDAIYLNTSYGAALLKDLFTLKKKYKKKYKIFLHIHFAGFNNIFTKNIVISKIIKKNILSRTTNIISLSSQFKKELVLKGFDENKISVLYNYFDPMLPSINEDFIINKYKNINKPITFLFVGSLDQRKGFYDLIETFKNLNPDKINLAICGKPNDYKSEYTLNEIKNNKIFNYYGYVSGNEKNNVFLKSNVLVLPSYAEGLPITILEALNFGLPIISTNVGAIPEIIDESIGILIKPGDLDGLRNTIAMFSNCNILKNTGINCLKQSKKYTFDEFSKNLINILKG